MICVYRVKVKLDDKIGIIPENFIEIMKKETPKRFTLPLPSHEKPPFISRPPSPEKKEEVCVYVHVCAHFYMYNVLSWFY